MMLGAIFAAALAACTPTSGNAADDAASRTLQEQQMDEQAVQQGANDAKKQQQRDLQRMKDSSQAAPGSGESGATRSDLDQSRQDANVDMQEAGAASNRMKDRVKPGQGQSGGVPCAVQAESCESQCQGLTGKDELSCKTDCKKAEVSCHKAQFKSQRETAGQGQSAGVPCVVQDANCENQCKGLSAKDELTCKAKCKKDEIGCHNPPEMKEQGRTGATHTKHKRAPKNAGTTAPSGENPGTGTTNTGTGTSNMGANPGNTGTATTPPATTTP